MSSLNWSEENLPIVEREKQKEQPEDNFVENLRRVPPFSPSPELNFNYYILWKEVRQEKKKKLKTNK